jgi:TonB-dependent SusC/RagA subfamily outer membrane receptor
MKLCLPLWKNVTVREGSTSFLPNRIKGVLIIFLTLFTSGLMAQEVVTGTVTSGDSALVGASVQLKGTSVGTTTDANGNFRIAAPAASILVISSVGFVSQEVKVTAGRNLNVQLLPSVARSMDEVIVVGYGTQKRADVTGAVASVPKTRFTQVPVTNVMQAIEGSVAGVSVTTNSQVPGRTATVQIRGINSITANNSPLFVIDGIPMNVDASTNDINPNDIASMEILKDASAVAIYGVKGSNGVILITTKRGSTGKPIIRYNGYAGTENLAHILTPASPAAYVQKYADYLSQNNLTQTQILPNTYEVNNYNAGKTVDWIDQTTQQGVIQDHNLSVSGGG